MQQQICKLSRTTFPFQINMIFEDDNKGNLHSQKADKSVSEKLRFTARTNLIQSGQNHTLPKYDMDQKFAVFISGIFVWFWWFFFFLLIHKILCTGKQVLKFINSGVPLLKEDCPWRQQNHKRSLKTVLENWVHGHWTPHCNPKSLAQLKLCDFIESGITVCQMNHSSKGNHGSCGLTIFLQGRRL